MFLYGVFFWSVFSGIRTERSDRFLLSSNVLSNSIYPLFSLKIAFSEILEKPWGFSMEGDHFIRTKVTAQITLSKCTFFLNYSRIFPQISWRAIFLNHFEGFCLPFGKTSSKVKTKTLEQDPWMVFLCLYRWFWTGNCPVAFFVFVYFWFWKVILVQIFFFQILR